MFEFDAILDDWHLLKRAPLRSRKQVGNLVRKVYAPKHSSRDEKSPLWWRQEALRNKWSGIVLDGKPMDGSAMLGLSSVKGIVYTTYIPNLRHRERLEMELGDLQCMITLLKQYDIVDESKVYKAEVAKRSRLGKWSNIFTEVQ